MADERTVAIERVSDPEPTLPSVKEKRSSCSRIQVTEAGDGPLLKLIRNATFISHSQLVKLAIEHHLTPSRQVTEWRLKRYLKTGLVDLVGRVHPYPGAVYAITRSGLSVLEEYGDGLFSITSDTERLAAPTQAAHFLGINAIRIALHSDTSFAIERWITDREVASLNYTIKVRYKKDYDALVQVRKTNQSQVTFALEYERTFKKGERYEDIAKDISQEKQVTFLLYVTSSTDMVYKLAPLLNCTPLPVCFTPSSVIRKHKFGAKVAFLLNGAMTSVPLHEYINALSL